MNIPSIPVPLEVKGPPTAESTEPAKIRDAVAPTPPAKLSVLLHSRFNEPKDLPEEGAGLLDTKEILKLVYCAPSIRKKYPAYFTNGHIRSEWLPLLFERNVTGDLRHPEYIISSNVLQWKARLATYENPKRSRRVLKSADQRPQPKDSNQQAKRPANETDNSTSKRMAKKPKQTSTDGSPEVVEAGREDSIKVSVIPTVTTPQAQSNGIPTAAISSLSDFVTNCTARHSHPVENAPQQVPNEQYNPIPSVSTARPQHAIYTEGVQSRFYAGSSARNFIMGSDPGHVEFLQVDWLSAFIQWLQAQLHRLNRILVEANEVGQSHDYQARITQLITALYQVRMACLQLESFLHAESMMQ